MNQLITKCGRFIDKVFMKRFFGGDKKEEKRKPTINVTQALQLNQEQGETKEKEMPATKPPEVIKKKLETILEELEKQESDIQDYFDIEDRRAKRKLELYRMLDKGKDKNKKDIEDLDEEEEEKNNFFIKHLAKYVKEMQQEQLANQLELDSDKYGIEKTGKDEGFLFSLKQKRNERKEQKPDRIFNSHILRDDPQIKDVISFTTIQIINNKQCEPDSYEHSQGSDMYIQDGTEWIKEINLIYIIQSISETEHIQEELRKKKKKKEKDDRDRKQIINFRDRNE